MNCLECHFSFEKNMRLQKFCSIKCRLKYNARKNKGKYKKYSREKWKNKVIPKAHYICPKCKFVIELDFNPRKEMKKLTEVICPQCKTKHGK